MVKVLQVLASLEGSGGVQKRLIDNYKNLDRENVKFDFIVHGPNIGELEEYVEKLGCNVFHVARKRGFGLFKNIIDINKVIKEGKYDIVQSHMERAGAIVLPLAQIHGVRTRIAHSHLAHIYSKGIIKLIKKILTTIINITATDFWACSKEAGIWLFGNRIIDQGKLRVVPNAIDVKKFRFNKETRDILRTELKINDSFTIVNVGRLSYQKNHMFLLDIFSKVLEINSNSRLLIVGEGELREELESRVQHLGIQDKVMFLGMRHDVNDILQASDVMLHPALFEGLGNVLIEAQAAGLPIIASDEGIPKETQITNIIKYMSLKEDSKSWAMAVEKLRSFNRRDTSEEVISANFDCTSQAKVLEKFYKGRKH